MISIAIYSESYKVRNYLQTFFMESRIGKVICSSGFHQVFFDHTILHTTQLAIIDITDMHLNASSFITRIFSHNPELDIIVIHFGMISTSVRSSVNVVGASRIIYCDSSYGDLNSIGSALSSHFAASIYSLTAREQQVLGMISEGLSSLEVAEELGISSTTVTVYRKKIAKKIGSNRIAIQTRVALNLRLSRL